ncbi:hypothetical protein KO481_34090 [Nocardia sp. NEAU-G5]|uniref:CBM6 domain-containing protein n=1 Tax=Nocardia albiluteola TaxID=2842303 RepID=A0ABS6BBE2_9NOCA|nr:hypothetical protein [Nocardia albiluteola]MBU3066538.1 hypothetical protein [Nocardia albiluteola]
MTSSPCFGRAHIVAAMAAIGFLCASAPALAAPIPLGDHPAAAANLVANADFHSGLAAWNKHIYNANVGGNGASVHNNGYVGQDVPVTKGAGYTFSVRAGASPGGSVLALALDSGTGVAYVSQSVSAPTTVSRTFTATGPIVYIACQGSGSGGWCNNFSLVAAPDVAGTGSSGSGSSSMDSGSAGSR